MKGFIILYQKQAGDATETTAIYLTVHQAQRTTISSFIITVVIVFRAKEWAIVKNEQTIRGKDFNHVPLQCFQQNIRLYSFRKVNSNKVSLNHFVCKYFQTFTGFCNCLTSLFEPHGCAYHHTELQSIFLYLFELKIITISFLLINKNKRVERCFGFKQQMYQVSIKDSSVVQVLTPRQHVSL